MPSNMISATPPPMIDPSIAAGIAAGDPKESGKSDRISLGDMLARLSGSYVMGMDADLAFLVMCEQIKDADRRIRGMMSEIRNISAMRDAIAEHIDELREFENAMKLVARGNDEQDDAEGVSTATDTVKKYEHLLARKSYTIDPATGTVKTQATGEPIHTKPDGISVDEIRAEIKRWENAAQELDQNREIKLIELNSIISKRANALELLSNMEKKKHESQQSIISNLR